MQPEKQPEDLHSIMSRFTSWAGKQAGSGLAGAGEGVREVPYEEAIERLRSRRRSVSAQAAIPSQAGAAAAVAENAGSAGPAEAVAGCAAPVEEERVVPEMQPASERTAVKRTRPAARGRAAAADGVAARRSARKPRSPGKKPEFRQVLAKSVEGRGGTPGTAGKARKLERDQRVSVRLSPEEERQLRLSAAQAGVTVSEYLRRCALTERGSAPGKRGEILAEDPLACSSAPHDARVEKPSGLGEWITLLRNRFLSSPARFAERA